MSSGLPLSTREDWIGIAHLLFRCARTVSELDLLKPLELLFERKQIPQVVVIVRISRKAMEPLEAAKLPWAQLSDCRIRAFGFGH